MLTFIYMTVSFRAGFTLPGGIWNAFWLPQVVAIWQPWLHTCQGVYEVLLGSLQIKRYRIILSASLLRYPSSKRESNLFSAEFEFLTRLNMFLQVYVKLEQPSKRGWGCVTIRSYFAR